MLGVATHVALSNKAAVIRKWGTLAAVGLGMVTAKSWLGFGGAYASNLPNWFQQASFLTLLGGLRGVGTRLTMLLALVGGSLATGRGRHIVIERRNPLLGFTMQEKMEIDGGQVTNASLRGLQDPGQSLDIPVEIISEAVDAEQQSGPFGAKGVGESGTFGVSPAIANAIEDAVGVRLTSLPLTAEAVYRALAAQRGTPLED